MKVAIVTGAGRGIGRAVAVRLARGGYAMVLVSRTVGELEETARLCGGENVAVCVGDVTLPKTAEEAVGVAVSRFGGLSAVVHSAGVAPLLPIEETTPEIFREVIDTNLTSAYLFARAAWGPLKRGGGGAIVNISSMASRDPYNGFSAYGAAKAGVNLLTLSLNREGKAHGIRVYAVAPGVVETAMFRKLMTPEQFPTENALSADEVAAVVEQCVGGSLTHASGETVFLSKT